MLNNQGPQQTEGQIKGAADKIPPGHSEYINQRKAFWEEYSHTFARWEGMRRYYRRRLSEIYRFLIPPGMRILEVGCGHGDLLADLRPAYGVGLDLSPAMVARARDLYPHLHFFESDAHVFNLEKKFDYIVCSDLVNELWDVQQFFEVAQRHCTPATRIVLNAYSRLWQAPRRVAEWLGLAKPLLSQNWLTVQDIAGLLHISDFEVIRSFPEILWPVRTPGLDLICNRYLVKLWPFQLFAITNFVVARPCPGTAREESRVSVVIPARNEAGNVAQIFDRVPSMGAGTELIFVEGHSTDETYARILQEAAERPGVALKILQQTGKGKGDAVRLGFANAAGELLMILDADLSVPPEDLPRFYEAWRSGKGDFINGVRLVYPMEKQAMRFLNFLGNKFFSLAFTWLLSQSIKDTLCGTKVLSRNHYEIIAANRSYFGSLDPFGDFDLIFGAAKYNLKIVDLPIRYRERSYGTTNIQRWSHGWLLLKMVALAMRRIKFI